MRHIESIKGVVALGRLSVCVWVTAHASLKERNMEDSQPKMVLEHLYSMCQSLTATNRLSLHIKIMNILYEFIQTIDYFRFLRDKLKDAPILNIDIDVDYEEWANKEWIRQNENTLIWEDKNTYGYEPDEKEIKLIVDYLLLIDEKWDRRRDIEGVSEFRKEFADVADKIRTSIEIMLAHSAITTNTVIEGIKKAKEELSGVLLEISNIIEEEDWSEDQFTDFVLSNVPRVSEESTMFYQYVKDYKKQKKHETLREVFFRNKLKEELVIFLKSDFIIEDYFGDDYDKENSLWESMDMESRHDIDNEHIYKKRLYILSRLLISNSYGFDFYSCPKFGQYLFSKRKYIHNELYPLKRFYIMSRLIMDDWDKLNSIEYIKVEEQDCRFTEEQIKSSNIPNNAKLFLTLVDKIIPVHSKSNTWVYVYGLLKTSKRFGYKDTLINFQNNIMHSLFNIDITYESMKSAKKRALYINKDYTLQEKAYTIDNKIAQLNRSIEKYFSDKVEKITKG